MLNLNSERWSELSHAYGEASDIPDLLRDLENADPLHFDDYQAEPWFSLWSALCHQGDIYTATYAAVPHILRIALNSEKTPHYQFFSFPARVEIARLTGRGPDVPSDLAEPYFAAIRGIHDLTHKIAKDDWDENLSLSVTSALLASKGQAYLADTIGDLTQDEIREFRQYLGKEEDE